VPGFSFVPDTACPDVCLAFTDASLNQPASWFWEFTGADPSSSTLQNPGTICYHHPGDYTVKLIVTNSFGTTGITKIIHLQYTCPDSAITHEEPLVIPNIFTPNGDNFNDEFIIKGLPGEFLLRIFNRWGQELFNSSDKTSNWKGRTKNNIEVPDGVYFYELLLGNKKLAGLVQVAR
jgi:gliding motility-associated-like protein